MVTHGPMALTPSFIADDAWSVTDGATTDGDGSVVLEENPDSPASSACESAPGSPTSRSAKSIGRRTRERVQGGGMGGGGAADGAAVGGLWPGTVTLLPPRPPMPQLAELD